MKILEIKSSSIPDVKIIRFARYSDHRGYFTEQFRRSDFDSHPGLGFIKGTEFCQVNESFSKKGVMRGLHFQWNPFMGKMVRTLNGHMYDLFLDIRKDSPSYGKIAIYDMPQSVNQDFSDWIWVPPGFAHGNFFSENTLIEYFCSGEYSPGCEASISPLSPDLDWSLCEPELKSEFDRFIRVSLLMSDKDRNGFSLSQWRNDPRSDNFIYEQCR